MINVLVFPCGSEVGLEVNEALKRDKHINLYGLSSVPCHGSYVFNNYIEGISFITSETFIDEINDIIEKYDIDVLIPAYDDVILFLSENRDRLHCKLITSSKKTCRIARSKRKTYDILGEFNFVPKIYDIEDVCEKDLPLFAKPDVGQGSQGAFKVSTLSDLDSIRDKSQTYVICELLPGREYTVDCFTDSNGALISASMRGRNRTRNGISVNTNAVPMPEQVKEMAEIINNTLSFDGVWFFQVKADRDNRFKLLEIAPRVAGSMSLSRIRGFNYILNSVYQAMGYKVRGIPYPLENIEEDRALSNKYRMHLNYNTVYVDLDDTIILSDRVNTEIIAFLYQCANNGKRIILLSRHATEERKTLHEYHIDEYLFSDIVHVNEDELKSSFIKDKGSIFIDDSFRERIDVSTNCNIPVFDLDGIVALMD